MKTRTVTMILCAALVVLCALTGVRAAQQRVNANSNTERGGADVKQVPGKKIGNIKTAGNIIHLELDEGVIQQNLFDLDKRTIRFTPVAPKPEAKAGLSRRASGRRIFRFSGTRRPARRFRATKSASRSSSSRSPAGTGTR